MRAAAILGLKCSARHLKPFQIDGSIQWQQGMPASADRADVILLFGGDGTIHRHLGDLVKLGLPVLTVPTGSGNDFARALGLRSIRDSANAWQKFCAGKENVRNLDLGVISACGASGEATRNPAPGSPRYFCSLAGVGLDSEVMRRANRLPRWLRGHGGYALTALPTIFQYAALPTKILAADERGGWISRSDRPTILAAFANSPIYGGGMKIAPEAKMDDGLLDVCVIGGIDPFRLACLFPTVYFGRHLKVRGVGYFRSGHVRVETEHPLDLYADGEYVCRTPAEIRVAPGAMRVVVPYGGSD